MPLATKMHGNQICKFFALLVLLFGLPGASLATGELLTAQDSRATKILVDQFETVFRSPADLVLNSIRRPSSSSRDFDYLSFPFAYLVQVLDIAAPGLADAILSRSTSVLLGAEDFHSPTGLGGVRSSRCYILTLKEGNTQLLGHFFRREPSTTQVPGIRVWKLEASVGEFGEGDAKSSSLLITQIDDRYLVFSNETARFEIAVKKLTNPDRKNSSLKTFLEWDFLTQHEVWGYRRYRHANVSDRVAAGLSDVSEDAESLSFLVNIKNKTAEIRLRSASHRDQTASKLNSRKIFPPLKASRPDVWESKFGLDGTEGSFERIFDIMGLLGFGVYV